MKPESTPPDALLARAAQADDPLVAAWAAALLNGEQAGPELRLTVSRSEAAASVNGEMK
jgi:hypothetical protein